MTSLSVLQVLGFPSADHKSFSTESEARAYLHAPDLSALQHGSEQGTFLQDNYARTDEVSQSLQPIDSTEQRRSLEDPTCQPATKKRAVDLHHNQPVGESNEMPRESPAGSEPANIRPETSRVSDEPNSAAPVVESKSSIESSQKSEGIHLGHFRDAVRSNLESGTADAEAGGAGPVVLINAGALKRRAETLPEEVRTLVKPNQSVVTEVF